MDVQRSKKLPHFSEYFAYAIQTARLSRRTAWTFPIAGLSGIGVALVAVTLGGLTRVPTPLLVFVGLGAWLVAMMALNSKLKRPRNAAESAEQQYLAVLERYAQSMNFRRLHRDLDGTAAQLLEAGSYYWKRIYDHLQTPLWVGEGAPLHLRAVRQQTLAAIDESMRELAVLCSRCLIAPGHKRTDLRDTIYDSTGFDVEDLFRMVTGGGKPRSSFQSEHLPVIFDSARLLAERLKVLSGEIERTATESGSRSATAGATASLDAALRQLQEIRDAERELEERL